MSHEKNYIELNRRLWDLRTDIHIGSEFYDVSGFLNGKTSLNEIELTLLGDLKGKTILHLQCHFGQDSISLARMGAKVTGVDLSPRAIEEAKKLNEKAGTDAEFICSDVYELIHIHSQQYDFVFTSYGVIGWLPDMNRWAALVSHFLKSDGKLLLVEFHPVVWMLDYDFSKISYSYFNAGAIVEQSEGTYTDRNAKINAEEVSWNHDLAEVIQALINQKLQITQFSEYDYSPYNCFRHLEEFSPGKFSVKHLESKIPMVYALMATKK
jgi:2-polyprenyl-3-methyl-5-hydroxy-6-metoxy-1,4-benzoquinol methylase